jgi:hypothetical protein
MLQVCCSKTESFLSTGLAARAHAPNKLVKVVSKDIANNDDLTYVNNCPFCHLSFFVYYLT